MIERAWAVFPTVCRYLRTHLDDVRNSISSVRLLLGDIAVETLSMGTPISSYSK